MFPQSSEPQKPTVWGWYVAYCVAMALANSLVLFIGVVMLLSEPMGADEDPMKNKILGLVYVVLGLALLIPFAAGPLLPRRKWGWVVGLILICFGMTSVCCMPAAIPLLISWIKPETKEYFYPSGPETRTPTYPPPSPPPPVTYVKCPGCGLNNVPTAIQCERCGTVLSS